MKNIQSFLWTLILVPLLASGFGCKKFLDRKPLQSTLEDLDQGALEGQVFGLYNYLRTSAGFSSLPWIDFHSIRDDDAQKGSDASDGREIIAEFETFQYSKDDWAPNEYWNNHFQMINLANNALQIADSLQVSDPASLRNIGEALFFRAYSYFELVKTYGEVPLINFKIYNPADGIRPKVSVDRLYEFIDSNLAAASALLPLVPDEYGPGFAGRVTKGSANALWAQTYLFRQNWARVVGLCNEIISSNVYSLPEFTEVWKDGLGGAGKNGPESIFEMNCWVGANGQSNDQVRNGSDWGTCQNVRQNGATNDWNLGWGWNTPTDNLVNAWDDNDPRKRKTVLFSGQSDGGPAQGGYGATLPPYTNPDGTGGLAQKYWNKKVYSDPAMRAYTGYIRASGAAPWINHRIIRYADVILMLAEAANEMNDGATAEANLEKVRDRASGFLGPTRSIVPKITFVNQAQMRTAIKNERRFEFAMEGYRFYDLVRWGDALSVLGGLGYTNRCRYYPIPQKAIDLSGGVLEQNPEW